MKYQPVKGGFLIRLCRNEKVMETLLDFIKKQQIQSGIITGIGAVEDVALGYFDRNTKQYLRREFNDIYEVVSFNGNISYVNDEPFIHAHIILGDREYRSHAGHFFDGKVAVTMELFMRVFENKVQRELEEDLRLNLLKLG